MPVCGGVKKILIRTDLLRSSFFCIFYTYTIVLYYPKKSFYKNIICYYQNLLFYYESENNTRPTGILLLEGSYCERLSKAPLERNASVRLYYIRRLQTICYITVLVSEPLDLMIVDTISL